jgi:ABC-2 type transport system ATP-binding protein
MVNNHIAIQVQDLRKRYGEIQAVQGISFAVPQGEIFGLLGPNGAGKSTTISMLSGLVKPTAGDMLVMGHSVLREPLQAKAMLGVVPQDIALYEDLSARENLMFWGTMYNMFGPALRKRVDEVLQIIGLAERQKHKVGTFSGGMKRRVNIGVALLHKPAILIMDEPTVGIDPQSRRHILDSVKELNRAGMTVLYTTHYMEEVEEIAHHIAIMDQGKVVASGTRAELVKLVGGQDRVDLKVVGNVERLAQSCRVLDGVATVQVQEEMLSLLVGNSNAVLPHVFEMAGRTSTRIIAMEVQEPNLEAVFLHLTGRTLRD